MSPFRAQGRFSTPVQVPGARLLAHSRLHFTRRKPGWEQRRGNLEIAMVPLVDLLLCVVLFMVSQASVNCECLSVHVDVPMADNAQPIYEAPVVSVTPNVILVDGMAVGSVRDAMLEPRARRLEELHDVLRAQRELAQQMRPGQRLLPRVVVRADRRTPSLVLKSLVVTATAAGYPDVAFMVERRG